MVVCPMGVLFKVGLPCIALSTANTHSIQLSATSKCCENLVFFLLSALKHSIMSAANSSLGFVRFRRFKLCVFLLFYDVIVRM
jgi:hypothetical protein